jgi:hypothetical protein
MSWNLFACEASLFGLLCVRRRVLILRQQVANHNRNQCITSTLGWQKFTKNIGVSNRIVTDLGKAFTGSDFCQDSLIDVYYSSVAHPRCNSQVERANGMVLQGIKDRIFGDASQYATRWLAKLPHVIWGLWTQVGSATGYSLLFLVYGSEAVHPTDLVFDALQIQHYEEGKVEETRKVDLDSIEEHHVAALMWHTQHE